MRYSPRVWICLGCQRRFGDPSLETCPADGEVLRPVLLTYTKDEDLLVGRMVTDRYRIDELLGAGGMGLVLRARHLFLERDVALKLLHPALVAVDSARERFLREARALSAVQHPNIVRITDFGVTPERLHYLVMELIEGEDLGVLVRRRGRLSVDVTVELGVQLCRALEVIHGAGLVHRDLKPANCRVIEIEGSGPDPELQLKVMDFGLARELDGQEPVTVSGTMMGTPGYMAPEQIRGERADSRADLYALGCMLWEMATGARLYEAKTIGGTLSRQLTEQPEPPSVRAPHLRAWFDQLVLECLESRPESRPPSVSTVRERLEQAGAGATSASSLDPEGSDFADLDTLEAVTPSVDGAARRIREPEGVRPVETAAAPPPGRGPKSRAGCARVGRSILAIGLAGLLSLGGWYWITSEPYRPVATRQKGAGRLHPTPPVPRSGQSEWFAQVVWRRGGLSGVGPLAGPEGRAVAYRFERSERDIVLLSRVGPGGRLAERDDGIATWEHHYASGTIVRVVARDRLGRVVRVRVYGRGGDRMDLRDRFDRPLPVHGPHEGRGDDDRTAASRVFAERYRYDADGYVERVRYLSASPFEDQLRRGPDGAWGLRYEREPGQPQPLAIISLGADGADRPDRNGLARIELRYDKNGRMRSRRWLAADGSPIAGPAGCMAEELSYDEWGNPVGHTCLDAGGEPVVGDGGYAVRTAAYDANGRLRTETLLGVEAQPTLGSDGYATRQVEYDATGWPVGERYVDAGGRPTRNVQGVHRVARGFDEQGHLIAEDFFSPDGRPTAGADGCEGARTRHDARSRPIERWLVDGAGGPCVGREGFHRIAWRYDESGNLTEESWFGARGQPVYAASGAPRVRRTYDKRGGVRMVEWLGMDGAPVLGPGQVARVMRDLDAMGNVTRETYLGVSGEPRPNREGIAGFTRGYDERGNLVAETYLTVTDADDAQDRLVEGRHPTRGFSRWEGSWDERGNLIEQRRLLIGSLKDTRKPARETARYDERGRPVQRRFFRSTGEPSASASRGARVVTRYDAQGRVAQEAVYGLWVPRGQPDLERLAYTRTYRSDERGRLLEEAVVKADGAFVQPRRVIRYDERGREVAVAYFDQQGAPVLDAGGSARMESRYDERGRRVEIRYYGADGEPLAGVARQERRYDERGTLVERRNLAADGALSDAHGPARMTWRYDERRRQLEAAAFRADGSGFADGKGVARYVYLRGRGTTAVRVEQYTPDGALLRTTLRDPALVARAMARRRTVRDPLSRPIHRYRLVQGVDVGGPADQAGVWPGDILVDTNERELKRRPAVAFGRLRIGESDDPPYTLAYLRDGEVRTTPLGPGWPGLDTTVLQM